MNERPPLYRRGTGIVLLNAANNVFVGQRLDTAVEAWQMPQGGIEEGEDPTSAALRELSEETGTRHVKILGQSHEPVTYDLPHHLIGQLWDGKYRGQTQIWFLMRFLGQDSDINLKTAHPEFRAWKWMAYDEVVNAIVPFKRELYTRVLSEFRPLLKSGA